MSRSAVPDAQYVAFLFSLAQTATDAQALTRACGHLAPSSAAASETAKAVAEARMKIADLPGMSAARVQSYFDLSDETGRQVDAIRAGGVDTQQCRKIIADSVRTLRAVRRLVRAREQLLGH